jgi:hypothetical protein
MIRSPHTQDIRDGWTITFLSAVLLGNTGIWTHPEFLIIKSGFDLQVGRKRFIAVSAYYVVPVVPARSLFGFAVAIGTESTRRSSPTFDLHLRS